jgi:hypothetical protein
MTFEDFKRSLRNSTPPDGLSPLLQSLWYDGKGDWESSHNIAQEIHSDFGSWIHAYLHRKEGDHSNAAYWYSRADKPVCRKSLDEEWESLVRAFLAPAPAP